MRRRTACDRGRWLLIESTERNPLRGSCTLANPSPSEATPGGEPATRTRPVHATHVRTRSRSDLADIVDQPHVVDQREIDHICLHLTFTKSGTFHQDDLRAE